MRTAAVLLILFLCFVLSGGEQTVRIADTVGDSLIRAAAVRLALAGTPVSCSQERVTPEKAFSGLRNGEYDLVITYRSAVPADLLAGCRDYAVDAAMIAVNAKNPKGNFTSRELADAFSGKAGSWLTLNGSNYQIHLMRLKGDASAVRIFRQKIMDKRSFAPAYERTSTTELLHMAVLNENALVLTGRPDAELSTGLKAVSVDGIYPSLENLKNGRYPLCERRTILTVKNPSAGVLALWKVLSAADMSSVIADHGLIQL